MIKRQFFKLDRGGRDDDPDSSDSSDSDSDSESEAEARSGGVDGEESGEADDGIRQCSGNESEDVSDSEIQCDTSGLLDDGENDNQNEKHDKKNRKLVFEGNFKKSKKQRIKDVTDQNGSIEDEDEFGSITGLQNHQKVPKGNLEGRLKRKPKGASESNDSLQTQLEKYVLAIKSVFKCRICPRIVCLNEESLATHLKSKGHTRSEKLLGEGRLKLMLNSDGEIEEAAETHAERHARTIALAQKSAPPKKNKGRQRQRRRAEKLKRSLAGKANNSHPPASLPAKKKRKVKD